VPSEIRPGTKISTGAVPLISGTIGHGGPWLGRRLELADLVELDGGAIGIAHHGPEAVARRHFKRHTLIEQRLAGRIHVFDAKANVTDASAARDILALHECDGRGETLRLSGIHIVGTGHEGRAHRRLVHAARYAQAQSRPEFFRL